MTIERMFGPLCGSFIEKWFGEVNRRLAGRNPLVALAEMDMTACLSKQRRVSMATLKRSKN